MIRAKNVKIDTSLIELIEFERQKIRERDENFRNVSLREASARFANSVREDYFRKNEKRNKR